MRQPSGGLVRASAQLPVDLLGEIDRGAESRGLSRSAYMTELLKRGLKDARDEEAVLAAARGREKAAV